MRLLGVARGVVLFALLGTSAGACSGAGDDAANTDHDAAAHVIDGGHVPGAGGSAGGKGGAGGGKPAVAHDAAVAAPDATMTTDRDARADTDSGTADPAPTESPFGIASSASSSRELDAWAPMIAATGIQWLRGFDAAATDARLKTAADNNLQVSGILFFSGPGANATFPVDDLPGWSSYVSSTVTQCKGRVRYWEVWNEPPNFTENKDPAAYGKIVASAYDAAKAVDPDVQIGLAVQSVNISWLEQAISAGAADHFDYLTVHPYETLGLVEAGWEAQYMSVVPTLRKMLAAKNPANADVPIWFTEIGEPVQDAITPAHQADTLIKAYVMGIAQGVARVEWFEGRDGDSGPFGLLDADLMPRPSYTAMKTLIDRLGVYPRYVGWVLLNDRHYAFVFQAEAAPVLVAWAQPGAGDDIDFGTQVSIIEPATGMQANAASYTLDSSPIIVSGVPAAIVAKARANRDERFPWGGDYGAADEVSIAAPDEAHGLHWIGPTASVTIGGMPARDCSGAAGQSFTVDPNFLSYTTAPIQITAVLRRNDGAASAGFNLKYESTNGWQGTGSWYDVPGSDQWYTQTWTIDDDEFVGKWGFHFSFDSDSTEHSAYSLQRVSVKKL